MQIESSRFFLKKRGCGTRACCLEGGPKRLRFSFKMQIESSRLFLCFARHKLCGGPVHVLFGRGSKALRALLSRLTHQSRRFPCVCVRFVPMVAHAWLGGWGRVAFSSTDDELLSRSPALAVPPGPRPRGTALLQVCLQVCLQLELWWVRGCEPTTIQHSPNKSMSSATRVSHQGQTPEHWTIGPQTTRLLQHRQLRELCECGAQLTASRSTNSSPASSICRRARSRRG